MARRDEVKALSAAFREHCESFFNKHKLMASFGSSRYTENSIDFKLTVTSVEKTVERSHYSAETKLENLINGYARTGTKAYHYTEGEWWLVVIMKQLRRSGCYAIKYPGYPEQWKVRCTALAAELPAGATIADEQFEKMEDQNLI